MSRKLENRETRVGDLMALGLFNRSCASEQYTVWVILATVWN